MKKLVRAAIGSACVAGLAAAAMSTRPASAEPQASPAGSTSSGTLAIPFVKYQLDNGLTVILHEDHALPLVAVNIMYKVGARFEEQKRTGFAHLFEHLMFMGTRRVPPKMFDAWMEAEGGWNNAWTSEDRTDYFDIGPAHTLPLLLWLEADRLSALGDEMTQAKLDAQRDVVRNERRQTHENRPYGKVELVLPELLWSAAHPYHHPVIGSHEDLEAATVADVKGFFARWYIPSNASLVVAGDFDANAVKDQIKADFGSIAKHDVSPAPPPAAGKPSGIVRKEMTDNVNLPKIIMAWQSPAQYDAGDAEMDILSEVLEHGKASRLYKALIYDKPLAQEVSSSQESHDLGSTFTVEAIARPGVDLDKLEAAIDAELKKVIDTPVAEDELTRAKNQFETGFVARLQSVATRATILNSYQQAKGDPGFLQQDVDRYRKVTAASMQAQAKATLDMNARVIIRVLPAEKDDAKGKTPAKGAKK